MASGLFPVWMGVRSSSRLLMGGGQPKKELSAARSLK